MPDPEFVHFDTRGGGAHWKRKGDESSRLPYSSKRRKDTGNIIFDAYFSELILPLFQSRGWKYNPKIHELSKDQQRLDCGYAVNFIRKNPVWTDALQQIHPLDQSEPTLNKTAFLDFLVTEIADRIILTEGSTDRFKYQAFIEAQSRAMQARGVEEVKYMDMDDDNIFASTSNVSSPTMLLNEGTLDKRLIDVTDTNKNLFVKATKRLPKMIPNDLDKNEPWSLKVDQLIDQVLNEMSDQSSTSSRTNLITAHVEDCKRDPFTQILSVQGRRDLVEDLNHLATKEILRRIAEYNSMKLLKDGRSVLCNIGLDITKDLGFSLAGTMKNTAGLWLKNIDQGKQLGRILDVAAERGAVLLSIGGEQMNKPSDKKKIIDQARTRGDNIIPFKFCLHRSLDPKTMKIDRILKNEKGLYFERVDGSTIDSHALNFPTSNEQFDNNERGIGSPSAPKSERSAYFQFVCKIRIARDLEFTASAKYCKKINSSMWYQHKELFGEKCEDNCPCLDNLKKLTENILKECSQEDALEQLKERSGFISNFIEKFSSKVRKEFPSYSPQERMRKYTEMWEIHKSEPRFGLSCTKDCTCGEIWSKMIKSSVNESETNSITPRTLIRKISDESVDKLVLTFPCNMPLGLYVTTVHGDSADKSMCIVKSIAPTFQNKKLRVGAVITCAAPFSANSRQNMVQISTHSELKEYYHAAKINKSKIKLWFDNSFRRFESGEHDPAKDWTETAAWLRDERGGWAGGASLANSNHDGAIQGNSLSVPVTDLREHPYRKHLYEVVNKKKNNVTIGTDNRMPMRSEAWLLESRYKATSDRGLISGHNSSISLPRVIQSRSIPGQGSSSDIQPLPVSMDSLDHRIDKVYDRSGGSVDHSHGNSSFSKDISCSNLTGFIPRLKSLKKVHFATPELCQYHSIPPRGSDDHIDSDRNEPSSSNVPTEFRSNVLMAATVKNDIPIRKRRAKRLLKSIEEGTLQDMIAALNDGIDPDDPIDGEKNAFAIVKKRLDDIKSDDEAAKLIRLKHRLLKIWSHARYAIDIARYVDESKCIQFMPIFTDGVELSAMGEEADISHLVTCTSHTYNAEGEAKQVSLPELPFQTTIDWSQTDNKPFLYCYNSKIDRYKNQFGKQLVVLFEMGNSDRKIEFGSWREYIDVIEGHLDENSKVQWPELRREMNTSPYMTKGNMTVKFKRTTCHEKYVARKRQEAIKELQDVSIWLKYAQPLCTEPINIASMIKSRSDGVNLLHAAVYLRDLRLVHCFLHQGCDSETKGEHIGTPLDLASNLMGKALKKCDRETDNQYHEIMRVLKEARTSFNHSNMTQNMPQNPGEKLTMLAAEEINANDHVTMHDDLRRLAGTDENSSDHVTDESNISMYQVDSDIGTSCDSFADYDASLDQLHEHRTKIRRSFSDHDVIDQPLPLHDDMSLPPSAEHDGNESSTTSIGEAGDDKNRDEKAEILPTPVSLSEGKHKEAVSSIYRSSSNKINDEYVPHRSNTIAVPFQSSDTSSSNDTTQNEYLSSRLVYSVLDQDDLEKCTDDMEPRSNYDINVQESSPDDMSVSEGEEHSEYESSRLPRNILDKDTLSTLTDNKTRLNGTTLSSLEVVNRMETSSDTEVSYPRQNADEARLSVGRGRGRTIPAWMTQDVLHGITQQIITQYSSTNDIDSTSKRDFKTPSLSINNQDLSSHGGSLGRVSSTLQEESQGRGRGRTLPSWMTQSKTSPQNEHQKLVSSRWQSADLAYQFDSESAKVHQSKVNSSPTSQVLNTTRDRSDTSTAQPSLTSIGRGRGRTIPSWMTNRSVNDDKSLVSADIHPRSNPHPFERWTSDPSISNSGTGRHPAGNEFSAMAPFPADRVMKPTHLSPPKIRVPEKAQPVNEKGRFESPNSDPNEKRDNICHFFGTAKGCKKGSSCPFVHVTEQTTRYVPNKHDWVDGKRNVCRYFSSSGVCKFTPDCDNAHINPNPSLVQSNGIPLPLVRLKSNDICTRTDDMGRITAAYKDQASGILYFAYGGNYVYEDAAGNWWYKTESDAIDALTVVVSIASKQSNRPRMNRSITL